VAGDTGDEVIASYGGSEPASPGATRQLEVECIAHWHNHSTGVRQIAAHLLVDVPRHGMRVRALNIADRYAGRVGVIRGSSTSIQPTQHRECVAVRHNGTRARQVHSCSAKGVCKLDYRRIANWNGDLNRNGLTDIADKFPVRRRIITNYPATWRLATGRSRAALDPDPT